MAYFPNGSSGEILDNQCASCSLGQSPCPVLLVQLTYNYDQVDKGQEKLREAMEILVDKRGVCQVKIQMDKTSLSAEEVRKMLVRAVEFRKGEYDWDTPEEIADSIMGDRS